MALDKFGIPVSGESTVPMMQPKRKDHFRVTFTNFGEDSKPVTLQTQSCGLPSVSYEKHEVHAYNSKMHYKGKYTWNTIDVGIKDTIDNGPLIAVLQQLKKEFDHEAQSARAAAGQYKFKMTIEQLDGTHGENGAAGTLVGWTCEGCLIETFNAGDGLDYSDSLFNTMTLTIQPDNCTPSIDVNPGAIGDGPAL